MAKFDFKRAKAEAQKAMRSPLLQLVILGSQGAGKSYTIGTLGVKTLYLYGTREDHGPKTANVKGAGNIDPVCFDAVDGKQLTADQSLAALESILNDVEYIKSEGYKAIAVDGLAVLESIVKECTIFREKCKTTSGKHNTFAESGVAQEMIGGVINQLKALQRELGLHIVLTGILDVKSVDGFGAIEEASPRLSSYGLAESLNQMLGDIVVVGKMSKNGETKYKFQMMSDLTKVSKDEHGGVKKAMNFNPRLSGCETPPIMDADLAALAAYKKQKMGA